MVTQFVVVQHVQLVVEMFLPMDNKCIHIIHDTPEVEELPHGFVWVMD